VTGNFVASSQSPQFPRTEFYLNLSTELGARHERACRSLTIATKCINFREIASPDGNVSHGRSATELAEGRFDMQKGKEKSGEAREIVNNKVHN